MIIVRIALVDPLRSIPTLLPRANIDRQRIHR